MEMGTDVVLTDGNGNENIRPNVNNIQSARMTEYTFIRKYAYIHRENE